MRPLGPFWAKRGQGGSSEAPRPQVGPPEPVLAPKPNPPEMAKNHNSAHGLWQPPEATSSTPRKDSPQVQGKIFPSSMHPTQGFRSGQIYVIPNEVPNPQPISKVDFQLSSLAIPWWLPEDHLRTLTTWPCRSWVVNSHQDYSKGNSQRLSIISIIFKASSTQNSLDNSIGPYR
ncbi:hypothetical protein O181_069532 [Austropuccinia psidii MF-1]|uniref:Uncharacterized protein n=1 Tax=Austropuccinia psidii MF-1 TaxID=1389203 RepID=A0A9Q3F4E1_9BASI|nr:hypothetical protein [Austropuccinia psidii MF-1]